jgi:ketosteroid isomerase-like protein
MKKTLLAFLVCGAALAFAQTTPPAASAEADAAINQLRAGLIDSFFKGDIDRLVTFLAPDVVATWQNGEVTHGPEGIRAYYKKMMTGDNRVVREIKAEPKVLGRQVYGDWAVSWGNLHDRFVLMDGSELPFNTLFTLTTAKRGDKWLVTSYHASVSVFENPVLGLATRKIGLWAGIGGAVVGLLLGWLLFRARKPAAAP